MPPDMPAAKFRPTGPRITTRPPVMYSQPWSPVPSAPAGARLGDAQPPGVPGAEPLAHDAAQEDLAAGGTVADHVARDDLLFGGEHGLRGGPDDEPSAGQALAQVVV